jgi:hypothetical protein
MANIFNPEDNFELLQRLDTLQPNSVRLWGTMTVGQMLNHCQKPMEVCDGTLILKQTLLGKLLGKKIKEKFLKSSHLKKNMPTAKEFKIDVEKDFQKEKAKIKEQIIRFGNLGPSVIKNKKHPFFGNMTDEEWGILHYKHLNHHFNQFGV